MNTSVEANLLLYMKPQKKHKYEYFICLYAVKYRLLSIKKKYGKYTTLYIKINPMCRTISEKTANLLMVKFCWTDAAE